MKVDVDKEACISCGVCVNEVPAVFSWDEDEKAEAISEQVPERLEAETGQALQSCPTDAIVEV